MGRLCYDVLFETNGSIHFTILPKRGPILAKGGMPQPHVALSQKEAHHCTAIVK